MKSPLTQKLLVVSLAMLGMILLGGGKHSADLRFIQPAAAQDECTVAYFAAATGLASRATRSERAQYVAWCKRQQARDVAPTGATIVARPAAPRSGPSASTSIAANTGPAEITCPPSSGNCYCWKGKYYDGCSNFASHCTSGLTCGPIGHVCKCTANP